MLDRASTNFGDILSWFGNLSSGAKLRLVLVTLILVWLTCIAAPAILIATLTAQNVTNLEGAVAFVQVNTAPPGEVVASAVTSSPAEPLPLPPVEAQSFLLAAESPQAAPPTPLPEPLLQPAELEPLAQPAESGPEPPLEPAPADPQPVEGQPVEAAPASQPVEVVAGAPVESAPAPQPGEVAPDAPVLEMAGDAATPTPWVIVVTNTPAPPTDTPVPTETPVPPTATPRPVKIASQPAQPAATPTPARKPQPPRDLDPRLPALNVHIVEPPGLQPGQQYWRITRVIWQNGEESGNDHTIYVEVLDENGGRIPPGQEVVLRWPDGDQRLFTEDKPSNEYPVNFPMFGTLGSYQLNASGLPSDTVVGLGMGTPEQPAFTIHTNFFIVFQRTTF